MNRRLLLLLCVLGAVFSAQAQLAADFTSDVRKGCSPIIVNFRDLSTGNPTAWFWEFGNGATSTLQNPSATFFSNGTYNIKLTVTNNNGGNSATVTKTAFITVLDEPTVDFIASSTTGCTPAPITFSDRSQTPPGTNITSWEWDFGDNQTGAGATATHVYRQAGSFTVTLTVTNDAGCKKLFSKPNYVNINPGVTPRWDFVDPGVCRAPATINFNNNSNGPGTLTYSWNFGDGTTSTDAAPTHTYTSNGTYRTTLFVTSSLGCNDSLPLNVIIGKVNTDAIVPAHICPRQVVNFQNNSNPRPISSRWYFSTGYIDTLPNAATSFPATGSYTVKLVNTYASCVDSVTKTINVSTVPQVAFSVSDSARCQPNLSVNFTNGSAFSTGFTWLFGDGTTSTDPNPSHTYTGYGSFDVSLIAADTSGCSDTLTRSGLINVQRPQITFPLFPHLGCVPDTVALSASVNTSGTVTSWNWNFGDNTGNSTQATPTHIYTQQGSYDVTLTVTTTEGCTETKTYQGAVKIGVKPVPEFVGAPLSACADPGVTFTNQSTGATDYLWNFGDGTTSSEKDPVHVFADTGRFSIILTAINNGCKVEMRKPLYVTIRPSVSKFNYKPDCNNPRQITFTDKSIGAVSWQWDFGDGQTFSGPNPPVHTYGAYGTYTVKLTTTGSGCTYTLAKQVKVYDPTPTFYGIDSIGCRPYNAHFRAKAPDLGIFKKYHWNFGDGSPVDTSQNANAQHIYLTPGSYTVTMIAYDTLGCTHTIVRPAAALINGPRANFGVIDGTGCRGLTVTFTDSTVTDGRNAIRTWRWDFGDSTTGSFTAPPFTHRYDSSGDYDVKLVVTDFSGCKDSITKRGIVRTSSLTADFTAPVEFCPNGAVAFPNLTRSDMPFESVWYFGDGQSNTEYNATHFYSDTGYYNVTLVVTDRFGCVDSVRKDSVVHIVVPKADFTANNFITYCTPYQAQFTDQSRYGAYYLWSFGPGQGTSTQRNPYTYYTSPGSYPVKLVVTFFGGCKDSVTKTMVIKDASEAKMDYTPLNGCTPLDVDFTALAPMNARFVWDFGDGNVTDTTINALQHRYTDFGDFTPRLIMREINGDCALTLVGTKIISLLGAHARFTLDTMLFCDQGTVMANSDSTTSNDPIVSYNWTFGDGGSAVVPNPSHTYTQTGQYDVILAVRTQAGCTDTMIRRPVKVVASPQIVIVADSIACRNDRISFAAGFAVPDTSQTNWSWILPDGSTSSQQQVPPFRYDTAGVYTVQLAAINSSGCKDSTTKSIVVHDLPVITMPGTITKVVGIPAMLNATYSSGVVNYNWAPTTDLSCTNCPQPVSTAKYNTLYTVTATDSNGCRNTGQVQMLVLCQGAKVFVPNTFSPNGDGANDVFFIQGAGLARMKSLRIFNRWGEVVFEQRDFAVNNPSIGWDGNYKGQKAAPDVYIYQLEVYCENSDVIKFEGNVALIR